VRTEELVLSGQADARYINLTCEDVLGHAMFDLLGGEIADRVQLGREKPADIVSKVLAKWRRFWGQLPAQILSRESQIGLFAELWFLLYWLLPVAGPSGGIRMWRGPYRARHDFESVGLSVEAKGTTSTRGRIHKVNGLQQLDPPESGRLLFFSLRLREEAGASNTLPLLVQAMRDRVATDADAEGMLENGLIAAGYLTGHEDEYAGTHYRVTEELLFDARFNFPRIAQSTFVAGVPVGVEEIEYTINLNTFNELILASKPTEASSILHSTR
jgi:hypothetical protein